MFFRRESPRNPTFQERLDRLAGLGFTVAPEPGGGVRVSRGEIAAVLRENNPAVRLVRRGGPVIQGEIAALVDGGFQKFFETPAGKKRPALASDLVAIHDFEEDLREGLGLISLYNESLGTVSTYYLYDRLQYRDQGVPKRVWEL